VGALGRASLASTLWLRARAEVGDRLGDDDEAIRRWEALRDVPDAGERLFAASRLMALHRSRGDLGRAAALCNSAIQEADAARDEAMSIGARLDLAAIRLEQGDLDACNDELDGLEPWAGDPAVDGRVALIEAALAARVGDAAGVEQAALDAREAAVEASDPVIYLQAVQMLVGARLDLGDEVTAWDAIVRARESLRDLLGEPGAELVAQAEAGFRAGMGERMPGIEAEWAAWAAAG
jgi:hypothetical protein